MTEQNDRVRFLDEQMDSQKKSYFSKVGLRIREAVRLHQLGGLLEKVAGKKEWKNVSEHCLVEAARAEVFSEVLGFSEELKKKVMVAAGAHDFFKRREVEIIEQGGFGLDTVDQAIQEADEEMRRVGLSEELITLTNASDHNFINQAEQLAGKEELSEGELGLLVMSYIDKYTIGSNWAGPVGKRPDGTRINDIDRRVDKDEANLRYKKLNDDGIGRYRDGETLLQAQRRVGHLVESRLTALLNARLGLSIEAQELPTFIDDKIKSKIQSGIL